MIAQIVGQKKPIHGEQGQYGYVRKDEEKPKRRKGTRRPAEQNLHQQEMIIGGISGNTPGVPVIYDVPGDGVEPSISNPFPRNSPAGGKMGDSEDSEEWAIRIGNESPPIWVKRKASEESDAQNSLKRLKSRCVIMAATSILDSQILQRCRLYRSRDCIGFWYSSHRQDITGNSHRVQVHTRRGQRVLRSMWRDGTYKDSFSKNAALTVEHRGIITSMSYILITMFWI
jgi:hypothetical protein